MYVCPWMEAQEWQGVTKKSREQGLQYSLVETKGKQQHLHVLWAIYFA